MRNNPETPKPLRRWLRVISTPALIVSVPFAFIAGCQSKLIYFPRSYQAGMVRNWENLTQGRQIDFTTSQGSQRAFLQGNLKSPRNLWIVCGGNATRALDWAQWLASHAPPDDAWLLVDFPGYGDCEGKPSPGRIRESLRTVVPLAAESVGLSSSPEPSRLRFFGHSLGGAACLMAASEFDIRQGVLLSPFTSTMEMSRRVIGVPLGFLVTHRFDNEARLDEIIAQGPARIVILHGTDDEVIPVDMSRTLAKGRESTVRLIEIQGASHNDIALSHAEPLIRALHFIGIP